MNASQPNPLDDAGRRIAAEASAWVARRDRRLTPAEQDAFLQWLREDVRHRLALAREESTWSRLDGLIAWQPRHTRTPNPDLLAPGRRRTWFRRAVAFAAGLMLLTALWLFDSPPPPSGGERSSAPHAGVRVLPGPALHRLADGSALELRHGRFTVAFSPDERRVKLLDGELHVTVAKDTQRPFAIEVDGTLVRATGTAFNVRRAADGLDVIVTEGRVRLQPAGGSASEGWDLAAGERARLAGGGAANQPEIAPVDAATLERELSWRAQHLEFEEVPLSVAIAEFNNRNARQLAIGDEAAGAVLIAGTFRADQVEAFARLLESGFGLHIDRSSNVTWIVRSRR